MESRICSAIRGKRALQFFYDGGVRTVEPMAYGVTPAGHEVLHAYQLEGFSRKGEHSGWKVFRVSSIRDIREMELPNHVTRDLDEERHTEGENPHESGLSTVFAMKKTIL